MSLCERRQHGDESWVGILVILYYDLDVCLAVHIVIFCFYNDKKIAVA